MIKMIHAADVHFDSTFGMLEVHKSEMRRRETRDSFLEMISYARNERINLMLLAGDIFESDFVSRETAEMLKEAFASIPECRIVIAPGNHDPYNDTSVYKKVNFPENVYIFTSEEVRSFDFPEINCTVYGYAFTSPFMETSPVCGVTPSDPTRVNILLAHADLTSPIARKCPMTPRDIERAGFDYTALGHIHNTDGVHETPNGKYYAYSGCFEGRDFGETGKKGAIAARIDKADGKLAFEAKFVYFSKRTYETRRVDITGCENTAQIVEKLKAFIREEGYNETTALRIVLEGVIDPLMKIFPTHIAEQISGLFTLVIADETLPLYDCAYLETDPSIRGAFFDRIRPLLDSPDAETRKTAALALRYGLTALSGADPVDFS